ncbi:MAG: hypothetical protein IJD38_08915, partial [Clostridia bacterium]|nr:hypothetical protein [Clostridia bacterium]
EGSYLSFRSREWKDGTDLATVAYYSFGGKNQNFNIHSLRDIPSDTALDDVRVDGQNAFVGTEWKGASDDCTPLNMNNTYIGANHGYNCIAKIKNTGKTEADIGSVWQNAAGQKFCLVRIENATRTVDGKSTTVNELWLCPFDDASMADGKFNEYCATSLIAQGDVLTHVSGATNTASITAAGANPTGDMQFYVAINAVERRVFLNGTVEIDPTVAGYREAEFVDLYESYRILYLPAVLEYLMNNAGKNTNQSHHSEDIGEAYVTVYNTYRFHKNGACVVYTDYVFEKDVSLGMVSGVQSNTFVVKKTVKDEEGNDKTVSTNYVYLPGSKSYKTPTEHDSSDAQITISKTDLVDATTPISSYFQMTDAAGSKAFNLGYNTEYGYGIPEVRLPYLRGSMGFYYTSLKMYPHLLTGGSLKAGDSIDFISYRVPSEATDSDFTVINWYWVGETIYLQLHTAKAVAERAVALPDYMVGMTATVIEDSTSFTVHSATIAEGGITVSSTDAGYAIIRLTPAN